MPRPAGYRLAGPDSRRSSCWARGGLAEEQLPFTWAPTTSRLSWYVPCPLILAYRIPVRAQPAVPPAVGELTPREREVLDLLVRGLSNPEICRELVVSEATAKTHVAKILQKLGVRDRVQAVIYAYETALVTPGSAS